MFQQLLKDVARGQRGARDLNREEAAEAADAMMRLEATPAQIGAFLIAERIKTESVEELQGFIEASRRYSRRTSIIQGIDCAGPYAGRKKSFYASFPAAFVLAALDVPVVLHGADSLPPKWGVTLLDLLLHKEIHLASFLPSDMEQIAAKTGILLVATEQWCPPLAQLRPIRLELGMRTVFNTVEKLLDTGSSPYLLLGVFHNVVFERLAKLLQGLGYPRCLIVQGAEGSEDLYADRPTRVYWVDQEGARKEIIDPKAYGLNTTNPDPEIKWDAAQQVTVAEQVLQGTADPAFQSQVWLNTALRLQLAGRVSSMEEGIALSQQAIADGRAMAKYEEVMQLLRDHETRRQAVD